jgi:hypothetical protein
MIRTIFLPVAAAALLAGCVTSGYSYREDRGGGYYYGEPSVEYREIPSYPYGAYGAYGDHYGPYGPYRYAYPSPYGYRYYGYGAYGYPYYYVPRYYVPRTPTRTIDRTPDRPRSPWRDLDEIRRRQRAQLPPASPPPRSITPPPRTRVTPVTPSTGTRLGESIERARRRAGKTP